MLWEQSGEQESSSKRNCFSLEDATVLKRKSRVGEGLQLHVNKSQHRSVSYLFGVSWHNSAILSHNLKPFSCHCKWMLTLHNSTWLWVIWCRPYPMWNTLQLHIYIYGLQILPNKPFQILSVKNPSQQNTPLPYCSKMPLNSGFYHTPPSFHSHLDMRHSFKKQPQIARCFLVHNATKKHTARTLQFLFVCKGSNFHILVRVFPCVNKMCA